MSIFTILFIILLIGWILGWGVFHVTSALIHILLIRGRDLADPSFCAGLHQDDRLRFPGARL